MSNKIRMNCILIQMVFLEWELMYKVLIKKQRFML